MKFRCPHCGRGLKVVADQRPVIPFPASTPISTFEMSNRLRYCLLNQDYQTIGDIPKTEPELLRMPNFGRVSLRELKALLMTAGWKVER